MTGLKAGNYKTLVKYMNHQFGCKLPKTVFSNFVPGVGTVSIG